MELNEKVKNTPEHYTLVWSNFDLKIIGPKNQKLENKLSYYKNTLELSKVNFQRYTKREKKSVFNILRFDPSSGNYTYQTMQGLIDLVMKTLKKQGFSYSVKDIRIPLVEPDLSKIGGFRGNQKEMFLKLLSANRSGILKAPTRWGKTVIISNLCDVYHNCRTLILAPGVDLLPQLISDLERFLKVKRPITGIFTGSKYKKEYEGPSITVCSLDSMHKIDKSSYEIVIVDEPHAAVTESRIHHLCAFDKARIFGVGATTEGRWSGNDIMIKGAIGEIIAETTFKQAVDIGMLCPIKVKVFPVKTKFSPVSQRPYAYKHYVLNNEDFFRTVGYIANNVIPPDWQTLIFIDNEKTAQNLKLYINNSVVAMDKLMTKDERSQMMADLKDNKIKRCICSNIYSTGVTINEIRCVINCCAGAGNILAIQKPGRLAEVKPGKNFGYMFDYVIETNIPPKYQSQTLGINAISRDAASRLEVYEDKEYIIEIEPDITKIKLT